MAARNHAKTVPKRRRAPCTTSSQRERASGACVSATERSRSTSSGGPSQRHESWSHARATPSRSRCRADPATRIDAHALAQCNGATGPTERTGGRGQTGQLHNACHVRTRCRAVSSSRRDALSWYARLLSALRDTGDVDLDALIALRARCNFTAFPRATLAAHLVTRCDPSRSRTCGPNFRKIVLYPTELWDRGDGPGLPHHGASIERSLGGLTTGRALRIVDACRRTSTDARRASASSRCSSG